MKFKKLSPYEIKINFSDNGGIEVAIGCCHMVYTDPKELAKDLVEYLKDPWKVIEEHKKSIAVQPDHIAVDPAAGPDYSQMLRHSQSQTMAALGAKPNVTRTRPDKF